jgi:hypothetical protein
MFCKKQSRCQEISHHHEYYYVNIIFNKKFWEELVAYFPLIRHEQHRKRRVQQFFYCCVYIRCRGNVFTEPLPSNDRRIHIETHRLMGGTYEVRR